MKTTLNFEVWTFKSKTEVFEKFTPWLREWHKLIAYTSEHSWHSGKVRDWHSIDGSSIPVTIFNFFGKSVTLTRLNLSEAQSNEVVQSTKLVQKCAIRVVNTRFQPPWWRSCFSTQKVSSKSRNWISFCSKISFLTGKSSFWLSNFF